VVALVMVELVEGVWLELLNSEELLLDAEDDEDDERELDEEDDRELDKEDDEELETEEGLDED
jgi:hypothetical protein